MLRKKPNYKLIRRRENRGRRIVPWFLLILGLLGVFLWFWIPAPHPQKPPPTPPPAQLVEVRPRQQPPALPAQKPPETPPPPEIPPAPALPGLAGKPEQIPPPKPSPAQARQDELDWNQFPRPARTVAETQIALARQGISSGSVDGLIGSQTRAALAAFQQEQGLPATGDLDPFTKELLLLHSPPLTDYAVTAQDLARLQRISPTWVGKSLQTALDYENILELISEHCKAHPNFIRKLNPTIIWEQVSPGMVVTVPDTSMPVIRTDAAFMRIFLAKRLLQVFDSESNLVAHFPCSIAQNVAKRPAGELRIIAVAPDPNYTFNPAVFPESTEARSLNRKLILPPGPNNPVGIAWISLNKPGYGIHGTPQPEQVGRTESHGCFRLANWNAAHLLKIARIGMPVYVEQDQKSPEASTTPPKSRSSPLYPSSLPLSTPRE